LKPQLRWLTSELSPPRDLDVFIARVSKLVEARRDSSGLEPLLKDLRHRRARAYAHVRATLNSFRFRDLILNTAGWIEAGDWTKNQDKLACALRERGVVETAADQLQWRYRKIRKYSKRLHKLSPARRHKLRIQTKKVRYASEFFGAAFPGKKPDKRRDAFVAALEKFQDKLGELNDITVHEDLSAGLVRDGGGNGSSPKARPKKAFAAGRLSGFEAARMATVLRDAERAARDFVRAKPFWR
jgi:triphosphatase